MELAATQGMSLDIMDRVKNIAEMCKVSRIEHMLSDCLENMPNDGAINFVGELNKNDIMH